MAYNDPKSRRTLRPAMANESFLTSKILLSQDSSEQPEDEVDLRDQKRRTFLSSVRKSILLATDHAASYLDYLTIKVIFWDLLIAVGDLVSDLYQGTTLLTNNDTRVFGAIALSINWIPGIVAVIHFLSMYRLKLTWPQVLIYVMLLILFYPIIPIVAYMNLLWRRPKDGIITKDFRDAEYLANLSHALSGGLESPIQLIFQLWLFLNGAINARSMTNFFTLQDWYGNTISIPMAFSLSIIFTCASILKAVVELNLIGIHVSCITTWSKAKELMSLVLDFLPFLFLGTGFRIAAILVLLSYLNMFAFLPIAVVWLVTVIVNLRVVSNRTHEFPIWIISFFSLFFPNCFTIECSNGKQLDCKTLQRRCFQLQTYPAMFIYGIGLVMVALIVYLPFERFNFIYSPDIILGVSKFSVLLVQTLCVGLLSVLLASMGCTMADIGLQCRIQSSSVAKVVSVLFSVIIILSGILPWFLVSDNYENSVIFFMPSSNHTVIIEALPLSMSESKKWSVEGTVAVNLNPSPNMPQKDSKQYVPPAVIGNISAMVVILDRSIWMEHRNSIMNFKPNGVVIVDNQPYRPSSPLPNLVENMTDAAQLPIVLLTSMDSHLLQNLSSNVFMWMSSSHPKDVLDPSFKCDSQGCLPFVLNMGHLAGHQFRSKECYWMGRSCLHFTNEQEVEPFCNGWNIEACPLGDQEFGVFQSVSIGQTFRTFRSSPASCAISPNLETDVKFCDDTFDSGWTYWLQYETVLVSNDILTRIRRRYCLIPLRNCILEERDEDICCQARTCSNPDLENCNLKKLPGNSQRSS
ncbi:uncharacterized protein LOC131880454 [Tigriopus californicus]|uniref:uncharacterized protein LOC131880454 n=1 Tax=Tigriopus californicus TaxID=6832 RepID=UPI0027DA192C|nr:uncharacterized protein LOC131880454 [Tigriopus californicus]XP_059083080.1 uncharacterized protein LOC131880454 [Tigriopus californicus]XP_059083081.1 uncharacterized protein LOC131880454 [Tigriopus californicus]